MDLKLQKMGNEIKENIKNQVNQLTRKLINCNKKGRSLKNKSLMEEESNCETAEIKEIGDMSILIHKIPIVKNH